MKKIQKLGISETPPKRGWRKGVVSEYLPWILIAVAVLAIVMITMIILKGRGVSLIKQIKDLFGG